MDNIEYDTGNTLEGDTNMPNALEVGDINENPTLQQEQPLPRPVLKKTLRAMCFILPILFLLLKNVEVPFIILITPITYVLQDAYWESLQEDTPAKEEIVINAESENNGKFDDLLEKFEDAVEFFEYTDMETANEK